MDSSLILNASHSNSHQILAWTVENSNSNYSSSLIGGTRFGNNSFLGTEIDEGGGEGIRPAPPSVRMPGGFGGWELRITLYSIIFLLSVVGNTLVIVTLAQHRRMRTVTNVFLLNLSISDLLLAVFCMPFTLIPTLLRDFIFGKVMCVLIRYLQGEVS